MRPLVALLTMSKNASYCGSAAEVSFSVRLFSVRPVLTGRSHSQKLPAVFVQSKLGETFCELCLSEV